MNILEYALRDDDKGPRTEASTANAQTAIRIALNTIAGSNLPSSQRLALICELEMAWEQAGLV